MVKSSSYALSSVVYTANHSASNGRQQEVKNDEKL